MSTQHAGGAMLGPHGVSDMAKPTNELHLNSEPLCHDAFETDSPLAFNPCCVDTVTSNAGVVCVHVADFTVRGTPQEHMAQILSRVSGSRLTVPHTEKQQRHARGTWEQITTMGAREQAPKASLLRRQRDAGAGSLHEGSHQRLFNKLLLDNGCSRRGLQVGEARLQRRTNGRQRKYIACPPHHPHRRGRRAARASTPVHSPVSSASKCTAGPALQCGQCMWRWLQQLAAPSAARAAVAALQRRCTWATCAACRAGRALSGRAAADGEAAAVGALAGADWSAVNPPAGGTSGQPTAAGMSGPPAAASRTPCAFGLQRGAAAGCAINMLGPG